MEAPEWVCECVRVRATASPGPCPLNSDVVVSAVALNQSLIFRLLKCAVNKQRKRSRLSVSLPDSDADPARAAAPRGGIITDLCKDKDGECVGFEAFCFLCGPSHPALSLARLAESSLL